MGESRRSAPRNENSIPISPNLPALLYHTAMALFQLQGAHMWLVIGGWVAVVTVLAYTIRIMRKPTRGQYLNNVYSLADAS